MKLPVLIFLFIPIFCQGQYCQPTYGKSAVVPIIDRVAIGDIDNADSGFALTLEGYSDYTSMKTELSIGETHTIIIETGDLFPHNIGVWIDCNRNGFFDDGERIDVFVIGGNNGMVKEIEFNLPDFATNGTTRLRVRAMAEPFGQWDLSMHPCLPSHDEGETEDYTVEIIGGVNGSVAISNFLAPHSGIALGEEDVSFEMINLGIIPAENMVAIFKIDNDIIFSENVPEILSPHNSMIYTFSEKYNFNNILCENISVELQWQNDGISTDNIIEKNVCNLSPINGEKIWYLHSNINGGLEPLGGDPFNSTTNEVTMNNVFGENNWQQGFFETTDINEVFSDSTCVVFLDGSFDHNTSFENMMTDTRFIIENWVAAGGKLFVNCAKESGEYFYTPVGFGGTYFTFYSVGSARPQSGHPILDGPYQPLAEDYAGFYYANSVIVGDSLSTVVFETNDEGLYNAPILQLPILAEKSWGAGKVVFGGLSPSQLVDPMQESMNLRANILAYLHDCEVVSSENERHILREVILYPNPVSTKLHIQAAPFNFDVNFIKVFSSSGSTILGNGLENNGWIDVSDLSSGVYFIELKVDDTISTGKFVKH